MNFSHITSQSLRRILDLTERKDELVQLVADVETEISNFLAAVVGTAPKIAETAAAPKPSPKGKGRKTGKAKSGHLKEKILAVLESAGSKGMRVKDIAKEIGYPKGNVSVWFSTTGKKLTEKLKPGLFAIPRVESKPVVVSPSPAKGAKPKSAFKKGKRAGALTPRILAHLEAAGPKGMRVKDIAAKLGLPGGNISVWISTTGKNLVTRIEPGVYSVKAAGTSAPKSPGKKTVKKNTKAGSRKRGFKLSKPKGR